MVDKELISSRNEKYLVTYITNSLHKRTHAVLNADGSYLRCGDPAEIFNAITEDQVLPFMDIVAADVSDTGWGGEHYGFALGYYCYVGDNIEVERNEVSITYALESCVIHKRIFLAICLLLCEVKLKAWGLDESIRSQYEQLCIVVEKLKKTKAKYDNDCNSTSYITFS